MRFADLDAVTLDAFGTLLELEDPLPALGDALRERGVSPDPALVAEGFAAEVAYYRLHAVEGRDSDRLAVLRRECARVFLAGVGVELDPAEFAPAFVAALRFRLLPGVAVTLASLRARGLALAVASNWDCSLPDFLAGLGIDSYLAAVVTSAQVGAEKPDPAIFAAALAELGVEAARTLHIGNSPADEDGARAAGLHFAHAPLAAALEAWR
jgi:putative hydrolase of the HAD superfamily